MNNNPRFNISNSFQIIWKSSKGYTILNLLISSVQAVLPLLLLYFVKLIIDAIIGLNKSSDNEFLLHKIYLYLAFVSIAFLLTNVLSILSDYIKEIQTYRISTHINNLIHKKVSTLNLADLESPTYQNLFYKAMQESSSRIVLMLTSFLSIFQNVLSLVLLFMLIATFHWVIACLLIVVTLPIIFFRSKFHRRLYKYDSENVEAERRIHYFHRIITTEVFAKEVRLHNLFDYFVERFNLSRDALRQQKQTIRRRNAIVETLVYLLISIIMFGAYASLVYSAAIGLITTGALVMYFFALQRGFGFVKSLSLAVSGFLENTLFLTYLRDFLNVKTQQSGFIETNIPKSLEKGILLNEVSFSYPDKTKEVLKKINLHIIPGQTIAIVGENGAGKSTLVKLLCKLYEATSGDITIEDLNYKDLSASSIQKKISVMFQDYILFNMTARENIWFGNIESDKNDPKIIQSAKKANIHDEIEKLPKEYETLLGKLFQNSSELSIGQSQKLALARAFYKDADILILDEPSSALDAKAEFEIFQQFKELSKGKTTIYISHRFSTVKLADCIYVMDKGEIIESGSHGELMKLDGKYAHLYKLQADSYVD